MATAQELMQQASALGIPYYDIESNGLDTAALQARIDQANNYDPNAPNPYAPTGAQSPYIDPNTKQFVDTYGYFDPNKIQAITQYSNDMQNALQRGDNTAYANALAGYRQVSGGLQPVWSYDITPQNVAANSTNPGGVNYQDPQQQTPPPPPADTTSGWVRDANGNLVGAGQAQSTPPASTPSTSPIRQSGSTDGTGDRGTPVGGIGAAATQAEPPATTPPSTPTTPTRDVNNTTTGNDGGIRGNPVGGIGAAAQPSQPSQPAPPNTGGGTTGGATGGSTGGTTGGATGGTTGTGTGGTGGAGGGTAPPSSGTTAFPNSGGVGTTYQPYLSGGSTQQAPITTQFGAPYSAPAFDPNQGLDPLYYGYQIGAAGNPSLSYIPDLTSNDPNRIYRNAQNVSYNYGAGNSAQLQDQQAQQGALYAGFGNAANAAYNQLAETPGYTDEEAANISREPQLMSGVTTQGQYDSLAPTAGETQGIQGDTGSYLDYYNPGAFNDINQSNKNMQYANLDRTGAALDQAQTSAASGIRGALSNTALDPTADYLRQAGMTDEEVDQMANAAARNVGLSTAAQIQDMQRAAAAAGTTGPLAIAALRNRIQQTGQTNAADAVVDARLAARQAQRNAATGVQQTQLNAAQYKTGQDIGSQEYLGNLNSSNALNQGQLTQQAQNQIAADELASQQYLQNTGTSIREAQDQANAARAASLYGIRQGNQQYAQQSAYNQNMGVQNALTNNYANIAQQRMQGQGQVRNYLTGQQSQALGAQQTAQGQQLQNYNAMTGALNANSGQWGNYAIGRASLPSGWQNILGNVTGAVAGLAGNGS